MPLHDTFRVAIFDEFLDAFARIPRAQQKKVNKFIRKFREDPTNSSINYESISTFVDSNLRTVRIDQAYRAIVLKPEHGNVYVLLWVDHHDQAMAWATHKRVSIHPETGALQVLSAERVDVGPLVVDTAAAKRAPLFEAVRDRELLRIGVPQSSIEALRAVVALEQLESLRPSLPDEAFEALFFIAEGDSFEEVERAMAVEPVADVDVADFGAALERDATLRRFVVVDDDEALEAMLDAPLDKWRVFLHPSQRKLVYRNWNGPVRVLGGAGTGKTVVAMHRATYLADKVFSHPDDRLLFTTFTRNLAADIQANLQKLCRPEVLARIEVKHLDLWVADLLRRAGYDYEVVYWQGVGQGTLGKLWENALTLAPADLFSPSFYRDEWELVVQPEGCETWEHYRDARRAGRGVRMSRGQRKQAWAVFEEYRHQLEKHSLREPEDALRDATSLLDAKSVRAAYRAVIVDEAQDMSTHAFQLLRHVVPEGANDLFIVGDGHQRIYRRRVSLGQAGVNIKGRGRRLRINYRTTDEIRRYAVARLEGVEVDDLDEGADTTKGYKSLMHGQAPEVAVFEGFEQEVDAIAAWLREGELSRACVVARTNELRDRYREALGKRGLEIYEVRRREAEDPSQPGVRVATMHRVKGLEFDRVVVAGMSDDLMPWRARLLATEDAAVRREVEMMERALLYVAVTRARKGVLVTAHGVASGWIGA